MYAITRAQAIAEYRRRLSIDQRRDDSDTNIRHWLVSAWGNLWGRITQGSDTLGCVDRQFSDMVTTASLPMPADFLRLVVAAVDSGGRRSFLDLTTWAELDARQLDLRPAGVPEFYLFSQDPTTGNDVLNMYPPMAAGCTLRLSYITQPPSFGDPDDPAADTVTINMHTAAHYEAMIALALLYGARPGEREGRQKAADARLQDLPRALHSKTGAGGRRTTESYQTKNDRLAGLR